MLAINRLKPNLSCGPDGLPPLLFKCLKDSLAYPLALIFIQLFSVGIIPDEWKMLLLLQFSKKDLQEVFLILKLMERIISAAIYRHLQRNTLLSCTQHGFIRGKSTCTNLLEALNDWTLAVQNRHGVCVAYFDFRKAFDTVSHEKLFRCLYSYGIRGDLLRWIRNFFTSRMQQTKVGMALSELINLLSAVIQGSSIGPVMFLMYIDGLRASWNYRKAVCR